MSRQPVQMNFGLSTLGIVGIAAIQCAVFYALCRVNQKREVISTDKAPAAVGPYSQAIKTRDTLYVAGCIGLIPGTSDLINDNVVDQADQALKNMKAILEAGGSSLSNVVKTTVLLVSMDDYKLVNEVYAKYFDVNKPARSAFAVSALPKGARVEIECIALVK
eukprot:Rmarinus@m.20473